MILILRRAVGSVFALIFVSIVLFLMTRAIPVSPARIVLGADATDAQISAFEADLGLDRPYVEQYLHWARDLLSGNLGTSFMTGRSLSGEIANTFPITFELVTLAFVLACALSLPLGLLSAMRPNSWFDHVSRMVALLGISMPGFWIGLVLILYVALPSRVFPTGGYVSIRAGLGPHFLSLALPAFTLGIQYVAVFSRLLRSSMLEVMHQDYIRTARAMGLSNRRVLVYILKNAAAPVVSVAAMSFGYCFGWALIVEHVYNIPGLSRALLNAINQRDYPLIQIIILIITSVFLVANVLADVLNAKLNPRLAS